MRKIDLFRQLQEADSRIDSTRAEIERLQSQLGGRSALAAQEAELAQLRAELHTLEGQQKDLELQAEDRRTKIAADEGKLYSGRVTNPKELQSLSDEVAQDRRQLGTVEDQLLAILERSEELSSRVAQADSAHKKEKSAWDTEQASMRSKLDEAQGGLSSMEAKRTQAASQFPPADLVTYETLRRQKGGTAVANVHQRTCQACRVGLTPSQEQRARIGAEPVLCHSCGRILFVALS